MKTERLILRTTSEFKNFLAIEAEREGVSVAELVRSRFAKSEDDEEALLVALTAELRDAVAAAKKSLNEGLNEAESVLAELRSKTPKQAKTLKKSKRDLKEYTA
jgi:hypothetical protein